MSLTISNNSAVASASYYLDKNQKALQMSIKRLASGKRIVSPNEDPGTLAVTMKLNAAVNRLAGARNNVQNGISFVEVQDGVLETAGRIVGRMAELKGMASQDPMKSSQDVESYNNEFRDLQKQLRDVAKTTFNGVSLFADYAGSADGHVTTTKRSSAGRSADNIIEIFTSSEGSWIQDQSVPLGTTVSRHHRWRFERHLTKATRYHRGSWKNDHLRIVCRRGWGDNFPGSVRTVDGRVRTGVVQYRLSSCTNRWWYVPSDFRGGQHLFDGDQSAFGNRTDRGCGYRRRECEPGEVFDSHTGVGCDGGSGQLDQRYRPDAAPVKEPWARPELSDGPTAQSANPVNLQTQMLSQITIHTGPRLPQPLWAVRAAWKPPGKLNIRR